MEPRNFKKVTIDTMLDVNLLRSLTPERTDMCEQWCIQRQSWMLYLKILFLQTSPDFSYIIMIDVSFSEGTGENDYGLTFYILTGALKQPLGTPIG
ncbi:hypothetical protein TNCV_1914191 [Trichonephila clavipes]|nr:hypothetical protein TNCV_1914191 [Trichonephila clavipes]